ncbi:MAG: hypothetical protein GY765_06345, partial [bacterium]|nr:hypothetical protein [bacterium]
MSKPMSLTVKNRLIKEKRDISLYHCLTKSAHLLSPDSMQTQPLSPADEGDYLHLSAVRGPGDLVTACIITLPRGIDFLLTTDGAVRLEHTDTGTRLILPPGPPSWQLKLTLPPGPFPSKQPAVIIVG